ncbi:hypothetical protein COW82_01815 [Candidatus Campbellbacteria bacterium CG22_combo_CG10-13_8_21_14_all_43_18]|uniref:ComEC/Rec2-related protein domain-containing protein n=1 Tax=Candidatus Campbellbacteria bacterium CG22_combo_CG10-13_8_21_14_all_43_18 TaxID=1974530 RepID=A0A2H0DWE2_9BACT|nr:MAG: hypothetical protein COW82_01815 [Candidatus Campbellbacteria bacterium CG22_combo_CG10-13_8_21_14_all_43_18]
MNFGSAYETLKAADKLFYFGIFSFLFGIIFGLLLDFGSSFLWLFLLLSLALFLLNRKFLLYSLLLSSFVLGAVRADFSLERDFFLEKSVGRSVSVSGRIVAEPSFSENSSRLIFRPEGTKEKIIIITERTNFFRFGQKISAEGKLSKPENFLSGGKREFDYVNYLSKDDIFYEIIFPKIKILEEPGFSVRGTLFSLKNLLISKINRVIASPASEYAGGLIFGVKESLGSSLEEAFRRTGLIHVVVLSGYNITIVAEFIIKTFSRFSSSLGPFIGIISIALFVIMTGASATIVRAGIMALLVILSRLISRKYPINRALFLAALLMVAQNPKILMYDPSFELSFLATLGLIHLSPIVYQKLGFITDKFEMRTFLASTLSTQIFVLPVLLNKVGEFSVIAPITNILVLPFIPLSMLFGFLTSILGIFSTTLSFVPGTLAYILLSYQLKVVEVFASISFASIKISSFPFFAVLIFYLGIGFIFLKLRRTNPPQSSSL